MKKNKLILLAGVCTLLTGCGGKKYTYSIEEDGVSCDFTLSLKEATFKMEEKYSMSLSKEEGEILKFGGGVEVSYKFTYTGDAVQSESDENKWTLTPNMLYVTDYSCKGAGKEKAEEALEESFLELFTAETVDYIMKGENVKIPLEEGQGLPSDVILDNENMTFTISGLPF